MRRVTGVVLVGFLLTLTLLPVVPTATAAGRGGTGNALVTLDDGADAAAAEDGLTELGFRVTERFDFAGAWAVHGPLDALPEVRGLPGVAFAVEDEALTPHLSRSRSVVNGEARGGGDLPEQGANVTIAVVDSGVDTAHPAFSGRIAAGVRFHEDGTTSRATTDADGHGTHVAGIALGDGSGSVSGRHRGLAPAADLAVLDISDAFTTTNAMRAFRWVHENHEAHDIRVVTNSWGREKDENHYQPDDPLVRASNALVAEGVVVVFSAGNRGEAGASSLTVEAVNPNVITVAATDMRGRAEPYSSQGPARNEDGEALPWVKPDISAPGTGIMSARTSASAPDGATGEEKHYVAMNGTSMAAPHVAGAAALLMSKEPALSPQMVAAVLAATARDVGGSGPDPRTGHGLLNVREALDALDAEQELEYVTVEKRQPVRADGSVSGAEGIVLAENRRVKDTPTDHVRVPLTFEDGTERTSLFFNWTGDGAAFDVYLVGPDGTREGPFPEAGEKSVRVDADVDAGRWVLEAHPKGVAPATDWTLRGDAVIVEVRALEPTGAPPVPQPRGFLGTGGFTDLGPRMGVMGVVAWRPTTADLAGIGALVLALGVAASGWRARRPR